MTADAAPVIVAAARTPIGTAGHALKELTVEQLAAPVLATIAAGGGQGVAMVVQSC